MSKKSEELVLALNDYLDKEKVEGGYCKGFRRVFNEGDRKVFDCDIGAFIRPKPSSIKEPTRIWRLGNK